jgi:hypothetical protein
MAIQNFSLHWCLLYGYEAWFVMPISIINDVYNLINEFDAQFEDGIGMWKIFICLHFRCWKKCNKWRLCTTMVGGFIFGMVV